MLSDKFKPKHYETILSLQCSKLTGKQNENAEEWMDHLRIKTNECECKEKDRRLKQQFINAQTMML